MKYPKKQTSPLMLLLDTVQSANLRKSRYVQLGEKESFTILYCQMESREIIKNLVWWRT